MQAFMISGIVALFSFLFSWSEMISEFVGRRTRTIVGGAAAVSMLLAFKYAPDQALDIVMSRVERFEEMANRWLQDAVRVISPRTVEPSVP